MKFKIKVKTANGQEWWEDYNKDIIDPQKWAEETIKNFNSALRPCESYRTLLAVEIIDKNNDEHHKWIKCTNGMSINFHGSLVDLMYCERCGITGKRYGLQSVVKIDSKFRKKIFQKCNMKTIT